MFQSWRVAGYGRVLASAVGFSIVTTALCGVAASTASAAPAITATAPANSAIGVPVAATVSAVFSRAMDPVTLTAQTVTLSHLDGIKALAAGYAHTVALKNNGTVVAWGDNSSGQTSVPAGLAAVASVAAGESHSVALKSDGTVVAWGLNRYGQTTVPAGLSGIAAVAAGFGHTIALGSDGTLAAWGLNSSGQTTVPAGLTGVAAAAAGSFHTVALKRDGTVDAWGRNNSGQAAVPTGLSGVVAVAAGWYHTVALKGDGTVVAWGENSSGQTTLPAELAGVKLTAVAAGAYHSAALAEDGTVYTWGLDDYGQTTLPAGLSGVKFAALATGAYHTLALKGDGTALGWGRDNFGQAFIAPGVYRSLDPGAVSYDPATKTALLTPSAPLPAATTFTATVSNGVRSLTGGNPSVDYSWSFATVGAAAPPTVTITSAVPGNGQAIVSFTTPAFGAGSAPTSYQVVSSPGSISATGSASPITVSGLTNGTSYTFTVTAMSATLTGPPSEPSPGVVPTAPAYPLSLSFAGSGGGSVHGGVSCLSGTSCAPLEFAEHAVVTLLASPDADSVFVGWSGDCGAAGSAVTGSACSLAMDGPKTAISTFSAVAPLRVGGEPYTLLSSAYAAAADKGVIQARAVVFDDGDLVLHRAVSVFFRGGLDTSFSTPAGETVVKGKLLIQQGTLRAVGLVLR